MGALTEFLLQKPALQQALEEAILKSAEEHPESFRAWWKALGEGKP